MATLFLDRDGVINKCMPKGQYVKSWAEFEFLEGSIQAISRLRPHFDKIIVVTNQQGLGKNLMSVESLNHIHKKMEAHLEQYDAIIDGIYYCPHLKSLHCNCRKPKSGMAWQAKKDFPSIDFEHSIMVGDSPSDMTFGRALGMKTIWVGNSKRADVAADQSFNCLFDFSTYFIH